MDEKTLPPVVEKAKDAAKSVWAWSQAHTMATACLLSFVAGFIVGKL